MIQIVEIREKEFEYDVRLEAGDKIQIYINENLTEVDYTVGSNNEGRVIFKYKERKV